MNKQDLIKLRQQAHHLKPVIIIGSNGYSDAVTAEVERALYDHELIKIKIQSGDKDIRREIIDSICDTQQATLVQSIGKISIFYKP